MHYTDVIGQEEIKARLRRQAAERRVPHAQLFAGPDGSGPLPMALAFATALLCTEPHDGEPCGHCLSCRMAATWGHPDLHFVFPVVRRKGTSGELVSDLYAAEWREQLADTPYFSRLDWLDRIHVENQQLVISVAESDAIVRKLSLKSSQGGYKVMIVWLPELMNLAAANKLLKILEEPPADTVFLLVSEAPERLLPTILSRTQRVDFRPLTAAELEQALVVRNALQPEDARTIARLSEGSYTQALTQLRVDRDAALFLETFIHLMRTCYARRVRELRSWADDVASWGRERQKHFLAYCQRLLRENFVYNFQRPELNFMSRAEADFARGFARMINERNVIDIMDELSDAQRDVEQNANPRLVFFDLALRLIVLLLRGA